MFLGMMQFWFGQGVLGNVGLKGKTIDAGEQEEENLTPEVERDRLIVIGILAFSTIFFWMAFEQAGGSMTIFAKDYTNRVLTGAASNIFKIVNTLLTIIPLAVVTWVLFRLFSVTFSRYTISNAFLTASFIIIWGISLWMLKREFDAEVAEVPASWFGILNSIFIIALAPFFSKIWDSRYNPRYRKVWGRLDLAGDGFRRAGLGRHQHPTGSADGIGQYGVAGAGVPVAYDGGTMCFPGWVVVYQQAVTYKAGWADVWCMVWLICNSQLPGRLVRQLYR